MDSKRSQSNRLRVKMLGLAGGTAFVALGVLGLGSAHETPSGVEMAGSGDAPSDTTYAQPTGGAMNVGATATFTTPGSVEATAKAVPAAGG